MAERSNEPGPTPVMVSWSSGKDSAWALHTLRQEAHRYEVRGIFTTVTTTFERVSIHSTPGWVLREQADKLGLPAYEIPIPYPCSNADYEAAMGEFLAGVNALPGHLTASHLAFGDLFLEDIRAYREEKLSGTGFTPLFPVWGEDTALLARRMIDSGLRAIVTALDPARVSPDLAGRWFDDGFLEDLPDGVDPLGENGEFHTCVVDGPMFSSPVAARPGRIVRRETIPLSEDGDDEIEDSTATSPGYVYADVVPLEGD